MIELTEALHALSVAQEYSDREDYDLCAGVLAELISEFPDKYRFGREVAKAIGAPEWGIDWDELETEITAAINAVMITQNREINEMVIEQTRTREARAAQAKKAAKLPRSSKFPEKMKYLACKIADERAKTTPSSASVFVLDRLKSEALNEGWTTLPTARTIANWITKHRNK